MHIRVLVEDASGKIMLEHLLGLWVVGGNTFEVKAWKGIGRLPKNLDRDPDPRKRTLLDKLPGLLRAAGKEFSNYNGVVFVVVDLDNRDKRKFVDELNATLLSCNPPPTTFFCFSIEEAEAWLLGDRDAVRAAYPAAKESVLSAYIQDTICGTWEMLADAVYPGGSAALDKRKVAYSIVGAAKCEWARKITPYIDPDRNISPSFQHFCRTVGSALARSTE